MKRLAILAVLAICFAACHKGKPPVGVTPPPPPSLGVLAKANQEFSAGAYGNALRSFEQYLSLVPTGGHRDEALFHLGLIYALPGDSRQDWQRTATYLSMLVAEFPTSPHKPAAEVILALRKETVTLATESQQRDQRIKQLNTELERLIRIDSQRPGG